jgi:hypothetical protein
MDGQDIHGLKNSQYIPQIKDKTHQKSGIRVLPETHPTYLLATP